MQNLLGTYRNSDTRYSDTRNSDNCYTQSGPKKFETLHFIDNIVNL